jgi:hypothetical protein
MNGFESTTDALTALQEHSRSQDRAIGEVVRDALSRYLAAR